MDVANIKITENIWYKQKYYTRIEIIDTISDQVMEWLEQQKIDWADMFNYPWRWKQYNIGGQWYTYRIIGIDASDLTFVRLKWG